MLRTIERIFVVLNLEVKSLNDACQAQHMDTLSWLTVRAHCKPKREAWPQEDLDHWTRDLQYVGNLSDVQLESFRALADTNHVTVRALSVLQNAAFASGENRIAAWCERCLKHERARIVHCIETLHSICNILESRGCRSAVIKSLDHWPDLGSDLDLYTTADHHRVDAAMREELGAQPVGRSWGDRLANKWNYSVPGLPELVEIHVQWLGQTGEHLDMARRVIERRVRKVIEGHEFWVPAPEERIVISALQRVYRHFYFRLCDMVDMALMIQIEQVDLGELKRAANQAGIWPGVATFLLMIRRYINSYGGEISLPREIDFANPHDQSVSFANGFLRVSKLTAAGLYGRQLLHAGRRRDVRALLRLPLLPPLAISALVAHGISGDDKGIW